MADLLAERPYRLDAHEVSDALSSLREPQGVSKEETAHFELFFLSALGRSEHGIPALRERLGYESAW